MERPLLDGWAPRVGRRLPLLLLPAAALLVAALAPGCGEDDGDGDTVFIGIVDATPPRLGIDDAGTSD